MHYENERLFNSHDAAKNLEAGSLMKADLSHSGSSVTLITATKTRHPNGSDLYGCCSAKTGRSMFISGLPPMKDRCHPG
jgi:hypothetical protein